MIPQHLCWGRSGRGSRRPSQCAGTKPTLQGPSCWLCCSWWQGGTQTTRLRAGDVASGQAAGRDPGQRAGRSGRRDRRWHRLHGLFPELAARLLRRVHCPSQGPGSAAPFTGCRRAPGKPKFHVDLCDQPCSAQPLPSLLQAEAGRQPRSGLQQPAPEAAAEERRDNPRLAEDSAQLSLSRPPRRKTDPEISLQASL